MGSCDTAMAVDLVRLCLLTEVAAGLMMKHRPGVRLDRVLSGNRLNPPMQDADKARNKTSEVVTSETGGV